MVEIKALLTKKRFIWGMILFVFIILFSFFGPLFSHTGEYEIFYQNHGVELGRGESLTQKGVSINSLSASTLSHPFGTDKEGRDVFVRLMYGGRVSILVALMTIIIQGLFGMFLGGTAGYFGKITDELIMRLVDIVNCIPDFPVILIFSAVAAKMDIPPRNKIYVLVLVIAFFGAMRIARVVRGQVLSIKEQDYMLSAEAIGLGTFRKIIRYIIPNVMPQVIVLSALGVGSVILTESALSFLGFGLPYPYASWGNMITAARDATILTKYSNVWIPPGLLIFFAVLSFNLMGDALEDVLNPKGGTI